jgi:hypothetical protein
MKIDVQCRISLSGDENICLLLKVKIDIKFIYCHILWSFVGEENPVRVIDAYVDSLPLELLL